MIEAMRIRVQRFLQQRRLARNMLWMTLTQVSNRLLRILSTVVVARMLGPEVYGLAALVLAINEMVHVLSHGGISGKIIQASDEELERLRTSGYWVNWIVCATLTLIQIAAAVPMATFYANDALILPIIVLAFGYLLLPCATIQAALIIRENRLGAIARVELFQSVTDTLLTLLLALAGFGLWALVLPKLLVMPLWAWLIRKQHAWRIQGRPTVSGWRSIFRFGKHLILIDLLAALRNNIDYLIIGRLMGVEALGIYYFAFNAGLGLSQGLIRAATASLYPHLCELRGQSARLLARMTTSLRLIGTGIVPIIVLQAALAPFYVPLVFGQRWSDLGATPLLVILCLSALPRILSESCSQLLRAADLPHIDTQAQTAFTVFYTLALFMAAGFSLLSVAWTVFAVQCAFAPVFAVWTWQQIRRHNPTDATTSRSRVEPLSKHALEH